MTQKTIYIAGPVTGHPIEEVREQFQRYQLQLEQQGYNVINPIELIELINEDRRSLRINPVTSYNQIMAACLNELCRIADEIHMLPGWQDSKGATLEREVAIRLGITIKYV